MKFGVGVFGGFAQQNPLGFLGYVPGRLNPEEKCR